ncbi:ABC transporter substrate-binding protein [Salinirubellus sp. GCM10025818]|jgi:multiple sugar transport system substrate-binding protein|uniref:ABC transporter substrate-binding protein n=1 Tax=Salinirubellus TaxID=2162630 RepID=UPI0030D3A769
MGGNQQDEEEQMFSRRRWLALTGAGSIAGLAGCVGGDGGGGGDGGDGGNGDGGGGDGGDGGGGSTSDGGGSGTPDPAELPPVHVLTDYNNEAWQTQWEDELVPGFTDETGIEVEMEYSGMSGSQENRLATLIQSGDPPGMNTSTFDQVADLWASDQLAEVTEVVDQVQSVSGELISSPLTQDDKLWQVSHGYYTSVFHYRQDVYDELGLEVPDSIEGMIENARVIDESDLDIRGYGLAGQKTGKAQDEFHVFLNNMGTSAIGLRWKDGEVGGELEVHYPEEEVTQLLEYFQELAQYSPDPTGIGWSASLGDWAGGRFAQQYNLNMWPAGVAASAEVDQIAKNTGVAPLPRWKEGGIDKSNNWQYNPTPDGHHVFANSENPVGTKKFLQYVYGDEISRTAELYEAEPTRFLPNYEDVIGSDTYQNFDYWEDYPSHLEGLEYCQNTIVEDYYGNVPESNFTTSPVALYVERFFFPAEMINMVVTGSSPQEAYEYGLGKLEQRFQEGMERFG